MIPPPSTHPPSPPARYSFDMNARLDGDTVGTFDDIAQELLLVGIAVPVEFLMSTMDVNAENDITLVSRRLLVVAYKLT